MSSYDRHKDKVEQARKSNGEFGTYEAGESGASLGDQMNERLDSLGNAIASRGADNAEEQRKNDRLNELARKKSTEAESYNRVAAALATHELFDDMRSRGIASLRVVDNGMGESTGYYVSHANDIDGEAIEEDDGNEQGFDIETAEHYNGVLQSHFTEADLNEAFEHDPVTANVDGWRIDAVDYETGEPVTKVHGLDGEQAAALRDHMLAEEGD